MIERPGQRQAEELVSALARAEQRDAAFRELLALGGAARAAVRAGLGDGRWEVRRLCVLWLMQHPEPADVPALLPLLRDPRGRVRQAALVAIGHTHRGGAQGELVPFLVERALEDESLRVRRHAVSMLAWCFAHPDLEGLFAGLAESERDPRLRRWARIGSARCRERAARRGEEQEPC